MEGGREPSLAVSSGIGVGCALCCSSNVLCRHLPGLDWFMTFTAMSLNLETAPLYISATRVYLYGGGCRDDHPFSRAHHCSSSLLRTYVHPVPYSRVTRCFHPTPIFRSSSLLLEGGGADSPGRTSMVYGQRQQMARASFGGVSRKCRREGGTVGSNG